MKMSKKEEESALLLWNLHILLDLKSYKLHITWLGIPGGRPCAPISAPDLLTPAPAQFPGPEFRVTQETRSRETTWRKQRQSAGWWVANQCLFWVGSILGYCELASKQISPLFQAFQFKTVFSQTVWLVFICGDFSVSNQQHPFGF